jgi:hypothetical protein
VVGENGEVTRFQHAAEMLHGHVEGQQLSLED